MKTGLGGPIEGGVFWRRGYRASRSASRPASVIRTLPTSIALSAAFICSCVIVASPLINEPGDDGHAEAVRSKQLLRGAIPIGRREQGEGAAFVGSERQAHNQDRLARRPETPRKGLLFIISEHQPIAEIRHKLPGVAG
jgi:hypothetical protein